MDAFHRQLNDFFVESFNHILRQEEAIIRKTGESPLTISELHLVEAISQCEAGENTVSDIAAQLHITLSSVTIGVNKLVQKGYAQKDRSRTDGRSVHITLTEQGQRMEAEHRRFHEGMVEAVARELEQEERDTLLVAMEKLAAYFRRQP
ncbi:MAG: MarR family transcriptional regulator [Oscillospiraceae bacterium]